MSSLRPIASSPEGFQPPADGYVHVQPYGEYPFAMANGSRITLVIDPAAVDAQIASFRSTAAAAGDAFAGLLCDYDHGSCDSDKSSEAAAWVTDLQKRADGLWAKMRWTDGGLAAVAGGRFRFCSNVHMPKDCSLVSPGRLRPMRVDRFALTNDPRFLQGAARMQPISSRAAPGTGDPQVAQPTQKGSAMDYKTLLLGMLGLPAEATDEQITAACDAAKEAITSCAAAKADNAALKSRAEAAEKLVAGQKAADTLKTLEAEGYAFVSRDRVLESLVGNHDQALAYIRLAPPNKGGEPLRSRQTATVPAVGASEPDAAIVLARNAAVDDVQKRYALKSRADAVARAQSEKPDLWK